MILRAYELSDALVLEPAAHYIGLTASARRRTVLRLINADAGRLLRMETHGRFIDVYPFGYAVFCGFPEEEVTPLLRSLRLLVGLDPESATGTAADVLLLPAGTASVPDTSLLQVAPVMLARSMAMHRRSRRIDALLDESEPIITRLARNRHWINRRILLHVATKLIRFEADLVDDVGLLDLHAGFTSTPDIAACEVVDALLGLKGRVEVHRQKLARIRTLLDFYSHNRLSATLMDAYWGEVVLLSIFPLPYFIPLKDILIRMADWMIALIS